MNIVLTVNPFWQRLASLPHLGLLRCTAKDIRAECDPEHVVKSMGLNRPVTKVWATRWLGLSVCWMYVGEEMTLILALRIAARKGGIATTFKRGVEFRKAENRRRAESRHRSECRLVRNKQHGRKSTGSRLPCKTKAAKICA